MVTRLVSLLLVLSLVWSSLSQASVATGTVRNVFNLTASGAAKVDAGMAVVSKGVRVLEFFGRYSTALTVGILVIDAATLFWDWYSGQFSSTAPGDSGSATGVIWSKGEVGGSNSWLVWRCTTTPSGTSCYDGGNVFSPNNIVGSWLVSDVDSSSGYPRTTLWFKTGDVGGGTTAQSVPGVDVAQAGSGEGDRVSLAQNMAGLKAELEAQKARDGVNYPLYGPSSVSGASNTTSMGNPAGGFIYPGGIQGAIDDLSAAIGVLDHGVSIGSGDSTYGTGYDAGNPTLPGNTQPGAASTGASGTSTGTGTVPSAGDIGSAVASALSGSLGAISSAISASQAAVVSAVAAVETAVAAIPAAISSAQSAVISAVQAIPAAITSVLSPELEQIGSKIDALPRGAGGSAADVAVTPSGVDAAGQALSGSSSAAPAVTCVQCDRVDTWQTMISGWQSAMLAAPIFGLVGRLAWPGSGSVQRVWNMGSWRGGALSIDLTASGIDTAITVTRFVVVGGAVIVAYMILFG